MPGRCCPKPFIAFSVQPIIAFDVQQPWPPAPCQVQLLYPVKYQPLYQSALTPRRNARFSWENEIIAGESLSPPVSLSHANSLRSWLPRVRPIGRSRSRAPGFEFVVSPELEARILAKRRILWKSQKSTIETACCDADGSGLPLPRIRPGAMQRTPPSQSPNGKTQPAAFRLYFMMAPCRPLRSRSRS